MPKCKKYIIEFMDHEFVEVLAPSKEHIKKQFQKIILRIYEQMSFDF